ncbi:ABC transporter permease [Chloroflexota bacterium]
MKIAVKYIGRVRSHWSPGRIMLALGLLFFALIVFGPLVALLIKSGQSLQDGNSDWLSLAIPSGRTLGLLGHTIKLAACVAGGGIVLGILVGSLLWRWNTGLRSHLRWLVLVLIAVPPYVHALAWSTSLVSFNSLLEGIGLPEIPLEGWIPSFWVQLMAFSPISVGLTLLALNSIDPVLINAGRTMRSDIYALTRIALPLAAPTILAGGGFLFLLSLMDYSVPSLFQMNVYSLEIFAEFSASGEPARAFLIALPLLLVAVGVLLVSQSHLRNAAQSPGWRIPAWQTPPGWPKGFVLLQYIAVAIVVAQIAVPLVSLISKVGTWQNMTSTLSSASSEISYTFYVAVIAALLCLPIALAASRKLLGTKKRERLWWLVVLIPLAIPPSLIGVGLITIWNRPFFLDVYGSDLMPVLASLARFTPLAAIILLAQSRRIDPLLIDAARVIQKNTLRTWIRIWTPMLAPGLLAAGGIVFALTLGELGATLLVAPPGQATLTNLQFPALWRL